MRNDTGSHRELDGARVDDADDVTGSGGLEDTEEWPVAAVLGVQLDDLSFQNSKINSNNSQKRERVSRKIIDSKYFKEEYTGQLSENRNLTVEDKTFLCARCS